MYLETEELTVLPLQHLLSLTSGELIFEEIVSCFSCRLNGDLEVFLKEKAKILQEKDITRTYFVVKKSDLTSLDVSSFILGYFTLSLKTIQFSENVSGSKRKVLTTDKKSESGTGYLIGQLGKNDNRCYEIDGKDLMMLAFTELNKVHDIVGGRFVFLDCLPIEKVVKFYEKESFSKLSDVRNGNGYLQMFCRLPAILTSEKSGYENISQRECVSTH